ncbi:MAG: DUF1353 domain-containing protein [Fusobacterium sp.]|nr:DUF1353 domain-containing protein [Fusobacterium sp.]
MKLELKYIDYKKWQLLSSFTKNTITVPEGFITDLATIPKIFWSLFEPFNKNYLEASVIHDYLYSKNCPYTFIDRKRADRIFLEVMKDTDANYWKRYILYFAVRIFGEKHFRK